MDRKTRNSRSSGLKMEAFLILGASTLFISMSVVLYRIIVMIDEEQGNLVKSTRNAHILELKAGGFNIMQQSLKHNDFIPETEDYIIESTSQRAVYDETLDESIVDSSVKKLRLPKPLETMDNSLSYDIHRCPAEIPEGYPMAWSIIDILKNWHVDNTTVPPKIYQGLCSLDWQDPEQRKIASEYRNAELPFLIHHHPELWKAAERWSHYDYLSEILDETEYPNEFSKNNHMMFWKVRREFGQTGPRGWKEPTEKRELSFQDWYKKAEELETTEDTANAEHWYFRLNAKRPDHWLYNELPIFRPLKQSTFFMVDPSDERGINCRFGSKGIIAEMHYDYSRNFILILHGQKRYILAHPKECPNTELYPKGHPSARHSRLNWSDPNDWNEGNFPQAKMNEVVLQAGDALYLPTSWFHFIVSLNLNYQCNARSGITHENDKAIAQCGF